MNISDLSCLFDKLFPICRSITGPGVRETLDILCKYIPFEVVSVPSGTQVFDWTVPQEWFPGEARLLGPQGEIVCDFAQNNLHLINYSEPFFGEMSLEDLQPHLNSLPSMPDVIPYVTSYYNERWGFCLTDRQRQILQDGIYKIDIRTRKEDGFLNYGVYDLPGETDEIVLISSYICHPSMANNELSGPLAMVGVYNELVKIKKRKFTYRFLLIPETIGSITYLSLNGEELAERLVGGLVLTCLGGDNTTLSFKLSRRDWLGKSSSIDLLARHLALYEPDQYVLRNFTPTSGSDERQFCSPGFNFPVIQVARTIYDEYPEYHTSADDKTLMDVAKVHDSARKISLFLNAFEYEGQVLKNLYPYGEPQLGKRGLYPTVNSPLNRGHSNDSQEDSRTTLNRLLMILSLADGDRSLVELAECIGCSALNLLTILQVLENEQIIKRESMES